MASVRNARQARLVAYLEVGSGFGVMVVSYPALGTTLAWGLQPILLALQFFAADKMKYANEISDLKDDGTKDRLKERRPERTAHPVRRNRKRQ
jgi:hypothetical protein